MLNTHPRNRVYTFRHEKYLLLSSPLFPLLCIRMGSLKERLSVPDFKNQREKQEYLRALVNGEIEVPLMNGGMGVGITEEEILDAMREAKGMGVYSAALPGHRIAQEDVEFQTPRHLEEMNAKEIQRVSKHFRERFELSVRGVNFMEILPSYRSYGLVYTNRQMSHLQNNQSKRSSIHLSKIQSKIG